MCAPVHNGVEAAEAAAARRRRLSLSSRQNNARRASFVCFAHTLVGAEKVY